MCNTISHHLFIFIQRRRSTLYFQKNNFIQISFWETIENKIIDPFSQKHQILVCIRKIWQKRSYFFMNIPQNHITRSTHCITSLFFDFYHKIDFCYQITNKNSDKNSDNYESNIRIHTKPINSKKTGIFYKNKQEKQATKIP